MNVIIIGNTKESRILMQNLKLYYSNKESDIDEIRISDIRELQSFSEPCIYILHSLQGRQKIVETSNRLRRYNNPIYVAAVELMYADWKALQVKKPLIPLEDLDYMDTLLIPICEHCNLNCKGCSHFSPLVSEEMFLDYERFCTDLKKLRKVVSHINRINFLGGEPLLHNQLALFIKYARELYPYTNINVVTNGILLKEMSENLIDTLKKTDATILLSLYPPFERQLEDKENWMKVMGISYRLLPMTGFSPMLEKERLEFPEETTETICSNRIILKDGILARCPMYITVEYFNKYFGMDYPFKDGWIDIYKDEMNAKEMYLFINKPHELCHYCARYKMPNAGMKDWACYKKDELPLKEDWF